MRKAILHLKKADPKMKALIEQVGPCRIDYREPVFETLVRSIVFQQLSGKAAGTIFNRFLAALDPLFGCCPEEVLRLTQEQMRELGLSNQKASYIRDLAERTTSGEIQFETLPALSDEEIIEHLTRVKGVGVWTVQMFLLFALQRPDVWPTNDLGVRAGLKKTYDLPELPKPPEMEALAKAWRPYRSYASWYLWRATEL